MKDRKFIYEREKELSKEDKERDIVVSQIDSIGNTLANINSDRVNSIYQLWALGYDNYHIACKLGMKVKDVKDCLLENKSEWKRHIKGRIEARILDKIDTLVDGLDESKVKESKLRDIADSMTKISSVLKNIDKMNGGLTGINGGLSDGSLLELGEKAANGLGEIEVSKEIQKIRFKLNNAVSNKDRNNIIAEHETKNIIEGVENSIDLDSVEISETMKEVDKKLK